MVYSSQRHKEKKIYLSHPRRTFSTAISYARRRRVYRNARAATVQYANGNSNGCTHSSSGLTMFSLSFQMHGSNSTFLPRKLTHLDATDRK